MFSRKEEQMNGTVKPAETRIETRSSSAPMARSTADVVSKLGAGMVITGNIMCDGALQIYGHVLGDIHASPEYRANLIAVMAKRAVAQANG